VERARDPWVEPDRGAAPAVNAALPTATTSSELGCAPPSRGRAGGNMTLFLEERPAEPIRTAPDGDAELAESWFGRVMDKPRIPTSRPPPPAPIGDDLADDWFR